MRNYEYIQDNQTHQSDSDDDISIADGDILEYIVNEMLSEQNSSSVSSNDEDEKKSSSSS